MTTIVLLILRFYKLLISPVVVLVFGGGCRYSPTCSEYTAGAIRKYGVIKGLPLSIKRILKCNSFSAGGFDPVT